MVRVHDPRILTAYVRRHLSFENFRSKNFSHRGLITMRFIALPAFALRGYVVMLRLSYKPCRQRSLQCFAS